MKKDFILIKCLKCGAMVKVIDDCQCADCGITCCGEEMVELVPNSTDASFEKHIPDIDIEQKNIKVMVNHVMEAEHYIEWVALVNDNREEIRYFKPGEEATAIFEYQNNATIYAYCNKHGLWKKEI